MASDRLPLAHLRVLDLTRARSGPTAARQFADWGADVIMVELPDGADELTGGRDEGDFQNLHRNKRSIQLDLKNPAHHAAFLELVGTADVLIENFRPGVKRRLGIDYETLRRTNPRLIYASISGFGQDGPNADRPGVDQVVQGYGGLMSITGAPGQGPMRAGIAVTDSVAGLYCTIAIMTALLDRAVTNEGRWVSTSLLEAQIALLDFQAARWLVDHEVPVQEGNHHPTGVPMGLFATADGHINLCAATNRMFARFAQIADREDWLDDPRFETHVTRYTHRDAVRAEVSEALRRRESAFWIDQCNAAGLPCGPVYSIDKMFSDPQVTHLAMTRKVESPKLGTIELVAQPISISGVDFKIRNSTPEPGEHTREVLAELGYDPVMIKGLL